MSKDSVRVACEPNSFGVVLVLKGDRIYDTLPVRTKSLSVFPTHLFKHASSDTFGGQVFALREFDAKLNISISALFFVQFQKLCSQF